MGERKKQKERIANLCNDNKKETYFVTMSNDIYIIFYTIKCVIESGGGGGADRVGGACISSSPIRRFEGGVSP